MNPVLNRNSIGELISNYCLALEVYYEWSEDEQLREMNFKQITTLLFSKEPLAKLVEPALCLIQTEEYHRIILLKQGVWNYLSKEKNAKLALACRRFMVFDIYPGLNR